MIAKSSETDRGWLGSQRPESESNSGSVTGPRASLSSSGHWRRNATSRSKICGPEPHVEIHDHSFLSSFPMGILIFCSPRSMGENNLRADRKMVSPGDHTQIPLWPSLSFSRHAARGLEQIHLRAQLAFIVSHGGKGTCGRWRSFSGTSVQGPLWDQTNGT